MNAPDAAVVLAGGASSRLGRDKAALVFAGRTLLARMVSLAGTFCPHVAVSGRDPAPYGVAAPWFPDETPGLGPLGGILTALNRLDCACLVLSCDLPLMDEPTLNRLLRAWNLRPLDAVMTTFEQAETGFIEALVAVYQPEAAPLLRDAVARDCRKLSRAIPRSRLHPVVYTRAEQQPFFNLNTPDDLRALRTLLGEPRDAPLYG